MGRVFVAGSINMDVVATAERHPKIGETVAGKEVLYFPGGKGANQAVAAAKQGVLTTLIGRLGEDAFGHDLRTFLAAQSIDLGSVQDTDGTPTGTAIITDLGSVQDTDGTPTGTAIITVANSDNTIVVIPGANALVSAADVAAASFAKGDVAVSQFEIPLPAISAFFQRARAAGAKTILNPAPARAVSPELLSLVDILVLNETELGVLTGAELGENDEPQYFIEAARPLRGKDRSICITLGRRGVLALAGGEAMMIPGRSVKAVDTTGAGDCFVGALAAQLAQGKPMREALTYANAAASICVQRMGAAPSMPTADEVNGILAPAR